MGLNKGSTFASVPQTCICQAPAGWPETSLSPYRVSDCWLRSQVSTRLSANFRSFACKLLKNTTPNTKILTTIPLLLYSTLGARSNYGDYVLYIKILEIRGGSKVRMGVSDRILIQIKKALKHKNLLFVKLVDALFTYLQALIRR